MALSEREQRQLDEIEESLLRFDPDPRGALVFSDRRRHLGGLCGFAVCVVGLGLVFFGLVTADGVGTTVAVVGFVLTIVGCDACIAGMRRLLRRYPLVERGER